MIQVDQFLQYLFVFDMILVGHDSIEVVCKNFIINGYNSGGHDRVRAVFKNLIIIRYDTGGYDQSGPVVTICIIIRSWII